MHFYITNANQTLTLLRLQRIGPVAASTRACPYRNTTRTRAAPRTPSSAILSPNSSTPPHPTAIRYVSAARYGTPRIPRQRCGRNTDTSAAFTPRGHLHGRRIDSQRLHRSFSRWSLLLARRHGPRPRIAAAVALTGNERRRAAAMTAAMAAETMSRGS